MGSAGLAKVGSGRTCYPPLVVIGFMHVFVGLRFARIDLASHRV